MKKTIIKLMMAVLGVLLSVSANAFTGEAIVDGIKYNIVTKGKVAEVIANSYVGEIVLPASIVYEGVTCDVTSIGDDAFSSCSELTSITIPSSVTSIGGSAFSGCTALTSITIPSSVTSIGGSAFSGCTALTSITIPSSVASIGGSAFSGCIALTSIIIPESVTTIGNYAFSGCSNIVSVNIPNSVISMGLGVFYNCHSLTTATIGNGVNQITGREWTSAIDMWRFHGAFECCNNLSSVTIGNNVTSIGCGAFAYCDNLTSVTIPNSVRTIGDEAFYNCRNLTSIIIGENVNKICEWAFSRCSELTDVYCYNENPPKTTGTTYDKEKSYNPFVNSEMEYATLHVPASAVESYKNKYPWSGFNKIVAISETEVKKQKCAQPTISYNKGKLLFICETSGASCVANITDDDIKTHNGNEVNLTATYNISVYAKATGYEDSDAATATLCWIETEPKSEDISNKLEEVKAYPVLIQSNDGLITVQGVADKAKVAVYTIAGVEAGNGIATNGTVSINTNINSGEIAIIKIGEKSVKVVMK